MFSIFRLRSKTALVLTSVALTGLIGLIGLNFAVGQKTATRKIGHLYSIDDPQFLRTMGMMLGP